MKYLRILVLVLMSIVLPIRGAVAATMLCPEGEGPSTAVVAFEQAHHEMEEGHPAAHHHASDVPDDGTSSGGHPTTCHFCASDCCMASMVGTVPSLGQPGPTPSVIFPAITAPIPAFQSGGQDRPPRTS